MTPIFESYDNKLVVVIVTVRLLAASPMYILLGVRDTLYRAAAVARKLIESNCMSITVSPDGVKVCSWKESVIAVELGFVNPGIENVMNPLT